MASMKQLVPEYLERAHVFERLAAHENDPGLRANFEKQALAYYKLAAKRVDETRVPLHLRKGSSGDDT
jgi:hypothetical protein